MMHQFNLVCDGDGGITIIDKARLDGLDKEIGALLNVVIDVLGETELSADYPSEDWVAVWVREKNRLNAICSKGLMFTGLLEDGEYDITISINQEDMSKNQVGIVEIIGTTVVFIETGELIQKILYPQLQLDILHSFDVIPGVYCVYHEDGEVKNNEIKFNLKYQKKQTMCENNVVDFFERQST